MAVTDSASLGKWIQFVMELIGGQLRDLDEYPRAYVRKEYGWNEFNKLGKIHPWCHAGNLLPAGFLFTPDLMSAGKTGVSFVSRRMTLRFVPEYHRTSFVSRPVKYECSIAHLGSTSLSLSIDLRDLADNTLYMSSITLLVMIDVKAGVPSQIPTSIVEKFRDRVTADTPPEMTRFEPRPDDGVFQARRRVEYSDVDMNEHLSHALYLRAMLDAGSAAAVTGHLTSFRRELDQYDMRDYSVEHIRSVRAGKDITIFCWECRRESMALSFEITVGSRVICRAQISFYHQANSKY